TAVQDNGSPIVSTDGGAIVFTPPGLLAPLRSPGATPTLRIEGQPGGYADVIIASWSALDSGECGKVTGQIFHRLGPGRGAGQHLRGELVRADSASEVKRLLIVAAVFAVAAVVVALAVAR